MAFTTFYAKLFLIVEFKFYAFFCNKKSAFHLTSAMLACIISSLFDIRLQTKMKWCERALRTLSGTHPKWTCTCGYRACARDCGACLWLRSTWRHECFEAFEWPIKR